MEETLKESMTVVAPQSQGPAFDEEQNDGAGDLASHAWSRIRSDIVTGRLAPGTRLRIAQLRTAYGLGATPLREALSRLVSERLVISMERRGFAVAPVNLKELRDLTDLRKLLEKEALRQSLAKGDDAWETRVVAAGYHLEKMHEKMRAGEEVDPARWEVLNDEFHEALTSACDSDFLLDYRRQVYLHQKRYRLVCASLSSSTRDVHEEHMMMQKAALGRNADLLCALTDIHLDGTYKRLAAEGTFTAAPPATAA
jgi:GntR family carbon starvation induced transcriptional regulator